MPITLPTIIQKVVLDTRGFNSGLKGVQSDLKRTQRASDQTGASMSRAMGSASKDFEDTSRSSRVLQRDLGRTERSADSFASSMHSASGRVRTVGIDADSATRKLRAFNAELISGMKLKVNQGGRGGRGGGGDGRGGGRPPPPGGDDDRKGIDSTAKSLWGLSAPLRNALLGMALFRISMKLLKFPAVLAGLGLLAQLLGAVSAAAIGLVATLGPLVGALGALPGALTAVIGGAVATMVSFKGVTEAVKAGSAASDASAKEAKASAKSRAAAARGVVDATRAVADAEENASEAVQAATERVGAAKRRLTDAQKAARAAQEDLTASRKRASEQLEDMQFAAEGGVLSEERAILSLARAREALRTTNADPNANNLDRASALLDLKEAELSLRQAQDNRVDTQEALNEGVKKGIDGHAEVVNAQERAAETAREAADAQRDLAQSNVDLSRTQRDSARAVADAQQNLRDAIEANTEAMAEAGSAADKFAEAMKKLSPAGQSFVRTLLDMKPQLESIKKAGQEALFPGLEQSLRNLVPIFPVLERMTARFSGAMGGLAQEASAMMATPAFSGDLERIGDRGAENLTLMGRAGLTLASSMRGVVLAADPLLKWMIALVQGGADTFEAFSNSARGAERMGRFFDHAREKMTVWGHIIRDFGMGLFNVFKAAMPLGDRLLGGMERVGASFRAWTGSFEGQTKMTDWFNAQYPVIHELVLIFRDLGREVFALMNPQGANTLLPFLQTFREKIPDIFDVIQSIDEAFTPALTEALVELFDAFANLSGTSGPLMIYLRVLTGLLSGFNELVDMAPAIKPVIFSLITLSASAKAFNVVSMLTGVTALKRGLHSTTGVMGGLGNAFGKLSDDGVKATGVMARLGEKIGTGLKTGATAAAGALRSAGTAVVNFTRNLSLASAKTAVFAAGAKTAAASQWLWNAALTANPIGLLVVGLALLGGAIFAAYRHFEPFRNVIDSVWQALQVGWDWVLRNWKTIGIILLAPFAPVIAGMLLLHRHWGTVWGFLQTGWSWIKDNWRTLATIFGGPVGIVVAHFDTIKKALGWLWDKVKDVFGWIRDRWGDIAGFFEKPIAAVGSVFDRLVELIQTPIDKVMRVVKGFAGGVGRILSAIGLKVIGDPLQRFAGWKDEKVPGRAQGGTVSANSYRNAKRSEVGSGFRTGTPRAIVGEGSRHPEFVIPTDPKYRDRAMSLYAQLGKEIGAMAEGGLMALAWGRRFGWPQSMGATPRTGFGTPWARKKPPPSRRAKNRWGLSMFDLPGQEAPKPAHSHAAAPRRRSRSGVRTGGGARRRGGAARRGGAPLVGSAVALAADAPSTAVNAVPAASEAITAAALPGSGFFAPANTMATINSSDIRYWLTHLDEFNTGHGERADARRRKDIPLGPVPAYREPFPVRAAGGTIPAYGAGDWLKDRVEEGIETGKAVGTAAGQVGRAAVGTGIDIAQGVVGLSASEIARAVKKGGSRGIEALWPKIGVSEPPEIRDFPGVGLNRARQGVLDMVKGREGEGGGGAAGPGDGSRFTGTLVDIGRRLQKQGFRVSEHPAFGGVRGRHSANSYHYRGRAIDVNFGPGGENAIEKAAMDRIAPGLRATPGVKELLWRAKGHYNHLHMAMRQGGFLDGPRVSLGDSSDAIADLRARIEASVASVSNGDYQAIAKALRELQAPPMADTGRQGPLIGEVNMAPNSSHDQFAKSLAWEFR